MLVVIASLHKGNRLVGYRLSNGKAARNFTTKQVWFFAKSKQIFNVTAIGTEENPDLSGSNGFLLNKLPEIQWQTQSKNMLTCQKNILEKQKRSQGVLVLMKAFKR